MTNAQTLTSTSTSFDRGHILESVRSFLEIHESEWRNEGNNFNHIPFETVTAYLYAVITNFRRIRDGLKPTNINLDFDLENGTACVHTKTLYVLESIVTFIELHEDEWNEEVLFNQIPYSKAYTQLQAMIITERLIRKNKLPACGDKCRKGHCVREVASSENPNE